MARLVSETIWQSFPAACQTIKRSLSSILFLAVVGSQSSEDLPKSNHATLVAPMSAQWIFGYGSLIWRPGFNYETSAPAYIRGWQRRFWQASPDHRGTEDSPGRVVTVVPAPNTNCWGMAYKIYPKDADDILTELDHRERAGYQRVHTSLFVENVGRIDNVLVYVADPENCNFTGECSDADIASVISGARGPSGSNREYLLRLDDALQRMQIVDHHVSALVRLLS